MQNLIQSVIVSLLSFKVYSQNTIDVNLTPTNNMNVGVLYNYDGRFLQETSNDQILLDNYLNNLYTATFYIGSDHQPVHLILDTTSS